MISKRHLSEPQQWLIEHFQEINHGSITFQVWGGEPAPHRPPHIVRTLKLSGGDNGPRPEISSIDFQLRTEHNALFAKLKGLPDGTRVKVKVAHGLPGTYIDIEEDHQTT